MKKEPKNDDYVLAVVCADVHLSEKPPIARSAEPDWYDAMCRPLRQMVKLCKEYDAPLVIAGDVFDKWNSPARLINFALHELQGVRVYAIPGQHDLENHSLELINRSAYWTLVESAVVQHIGPGVIVELPGAIPLRLHGFAWKVPLKPNKKRHPLAVEVAVMHRYVWRKDRGHAKATAESHADNLAKDLRGYDICITGDNHSPFNCKVGDCILYNCGGLMRRTKAEIDHTPSVGLIRHNKERGAYVERVLLDCSTDKFLHLPESVTKSDGSSLNAGEFLEELGGLVDAAIDFRSAVLRCLEEKGVDQQTREVILRAMEGSKNG